MKRLFNELCNLMIKYSFKPEKKLAQYFLVDEKVINFLVENAKINKNDIVVEIGAGCGFITRELIKKCKKLIAYEVDEKLQNLLKEEFKSSMIKSFSLETLSNVSKNSVIIIRASCASENGTAEVEFKFFLDKVGIISKLESLIKKGGLIMQKFMNFKDNISTNSPPGKIRLSPPTLNNLLYGLRIAVKDSGELLDSNSTFKQFPP